MALTMDRAKHTNTVASGAMSKLRFAFLNNRSHPRGNLMLSRLIAAGFHPELVIEEDSEAALKGLEEQERYLKDSSISLAAETVLEQCEINKINHRMVENFNDANTREILAVCFLPYIFLGDTRILRKDIIGTSKNGIVNIHPGYLPDVKGNNPYIWASLLNLPQGVTAHFIDEKVDTGPIILRMPIETDDNSDFHDLIDQINCVCASALVDVARSLEDGTANVSKQSIAETITFKKAPDEIIDYVISNLNRQKMIANRIR